MNTVSAVFRFLNNDDIDSVPDIATIKDAAGESRESKLVNTRPSDSIPLTCTQRTSTTC